MLTAIEILNEIRKLPLHERTILKEKILEGSESNGMTEPQINQDDFDRILFDDGFLTKRGVKGVLREMLSEGMISRIPEGITNDEDDFKPVKINGRPISETILEDRD
ncbi:MAG: hypothetical protein ACKVRN_09225 [Pyrinomonadaceae bacterium]